MTLFLNTENNKLYTIQIMYSNFPIPAREGVYKLATQILGNGTIRIMTDEHFEKFRTIGVM